jgi:hypothetical protein
VILRDEGNDPLADIPRVTSNIDFAKSIFSQANVNIVPVDGEFIKIYQYPAPTAALDLECETLNAYLNYFGESGDFFRTNSVKTFFRSQTGYGSPITAFIVRSIKNEDDGFIQGCTGSRYGNYVTVSLRGIGLALDGFRLGDDPLTAIAHEIGHLCWLTHTAVASNLMSTTYGGGTNLTHGQKAWLRSSRHVTYF